MGYTPPWFNLTKVGVDTYLKPIGVTGDVLNIYANSTDALPVINLTGNGNIALNLPTGGIVYMQESGNNFIKFQRTSPDAIITSMQANDNIAFVPNGTGKVKFGTFTGSGDVAVNGSISILDSSGNARKLATVA